MNKQKLITILVTALVSAAGAWLAAGGCNGPTDPQIVTHTVEKPVKEVVQLPGRTITLPGRIEYVTLPSADASDSARAAWEAERARLHEQLNQTLLELAYYQSLAAVADTTIERELLLVRNDERHVIPYSDRLTLEYQYPPVNQFTVRTETTRIEIPDAVATETVGLPWWAETLIGLAGLAIGIIAK